MMCETAFVKVKIHHLWRATEFKYSVDQDILDINHELSCARGPAWSQSKQQQREDLLLYFQD